MTFIGSSILPRNEDKEIMVNLPLETLTGGVEEINTDHALIHKGYGLCASIYLATLAANGTKVWRLKGPTTRFAHIKSLHVSSQGAPLKIELIRNATITNAGTEISGAIKNLNDNSLVVAQSKMYDSTVTFTGGDAWCTVVVNGETTNQSVTAGQFVQNQNQEYVTKSGDTDYIIKITNLSSTDTASHLIFGMFFYEESQGLG
jgi:hypothetical protein